MLQVSEKVINDDGKKDAFLGIDIGSVSCKFVLMDVDGNVLTDVFLRNRGFPSILLRAGWHN